MVAVVVVVVVVVVVAVGVGVAALVLATVLVLAAAAAAAPKGGHVGELTRTGLGDYVEATRALRWGYAEQKLNPGQARINPINPLSLQDARLTLAFSVKRTDYS